MEIITKGKGKVSESVVGDTTTLLAEPNEIWHFQYFIVDGGVKEVNPLSFKTSDVGSVEAHFCVTIETYLKGKVGFEIDELALNSIRLDRGVAENANVEDVSSMIKDLMYADLLMWASTNPTSYTGTKESDDGWSKTEAGKTISVNDKKSFRAMAMEIYKKYGDDRYTSKIQIVSLR